MPPDASPHHPFGSCRWVDWTFNKSIHPPADQHPGVVQISNRICTGMNYLQALYRGAFVESEFYQILFGVVGVFGGFRVFFVTPWLRGRLNGSAEVEFQADGVALAGPVDAVLQGLVVGEIEEPEIVVALRQDLRGVFVGREDLAGR